MAYTDEKATVPADDEIKRVRDKLLTLNEKIKQYTKLHKKPGRTLENQAEYKSANTGELSLEDMHSKLHAINDYIRKRALGQKVSKPVFEAKPAKRAAKLSDEIVHEEVEQIGQMQEEADVEPDETATADLPEIFTESKTHIAARTGVGLDLGTAYIVASREVEDKRVFVKNERNAFLSVRSDDSTKELLSKLKVKYVGLKDKLFVLGGMALELADIFGRETQRSMNLGILNPSESESIPIIKLLIENIVWQPRKSGEICSFSIPAQPIDRNQDTIYHRGVFEGMIRSIGFEPLVIDEGYAVVLSEMEFADFTGIGVSCGAGMVNICAAYNSMPVVSFSITRGGDWIDKSAAGVLGVPSSRVTSIKEKGMDIKSPNSREEEAISIYYRNYIHYFLENMAQVFGKSANKPDFKKPVTVVFAGGSSMVGGFLEVIEEEIKTIDFGFAIGGVQKANEPFTSVARGCLFNAITAGSAK